MDEAKAFLAALADRAPDEPTACRDWRVQDLVAHLAAGAQEESDLIEVSLRGGPPQPTRAFAEREAAYRAMPYPQLLAAVARAGARLNAAIGALVSAGGTVEFTGTPLTGDDLRTHNRSELVVHRWDIAGDDDIGRRLLAQPDLTVHAVKVLSTMTSLQESIAARAARLADVPDDFAFRLRSPGSDDVLVRVAPTPSLEICPANAGATAVQSSPGDRLLVLWGRRPADNSIDMSGIPAPEAHLIEAILYI